MTTSHHHGSTTITNIRRCRFDCLTVISWRALISLSATQRRSTNRSGVVWSQFPRWQQPRRPVTVCVCVCVCVPPTSKDKLTGNIDQLSGQRHRRRLSRSVDRWMSAGFAPRERRRKSRIRAAAGRRRGWPCIAAARITHKFSDLIRRCRRRRPLLNWF